jgi:hypothetical protein
MSLEDLIKSQVQNVFLNPNLNPTETVTYTPAGGSPISLRAVVERNEGLALNPYDDGHGSTKIITLYVDSTIVTSPTVDDTFTIDSLIWKVAGSPEKDGVGFTKLTVKNYQQYEKSGGDYRKKR